MYGDPTPLPCGSVNHMSNPELLFHGQRSLLRLGEDGDDESLFVGYTLDAVVYKSESYVFTETRLSPERIR